MVGVLEMRGLVAAAAGAPQLQLTVEVDGAGRVALDARDLDSGRHEQWRQAGGHVVFTVCEAP